MTTWRMFHDKERAEIVDWVAGGGYVLISMGADQYMLMAKRVGQLGRAYATISGQSTATAIEKAKANASTLWLDEFQGFPVMRIYDKAEIARAQVLCKSGTSVVPEASGYQDHDFQASMFQSFIPGDHTLGGDSDREDVLKLLRAHGPVHVQELIEQAKRRGLAQSAAAIRTRLRELVELGAAEETGETVKLPSGREEPLWRAN